MSNPHLFLFCVFTTVPANSHIVDSKRDRFVYGWGRCERLDGPQVWKRAREGIWRGAGDVKLCVGEERERERETETEDDRTLTHADTGKEVGRRWGSLTARLKERWRWRRWEGARGHRPFNEAGKRRAKRKMAELYWWIKSYVGCISSVISVWQLSLYGGKQTL